MAISPFAEREETLNKRLRHFRAVFLASGLLLLVAGLCALTWRAWQQEKMDKELAQSVLAGLNKSTILSLLEHGANPNVDCEHALPPAPLTWQEWVSHYVTHKTHARGTNPVLVVASGRGQTETVTLLLSFGATINIRNEIGWTPLMRSVAGVHPDAVATLLRHHADVTLKADDGLTALALTASPPTLDVTANNHIRKMLQQAGATQ